VVTHGDGGADHEADLSTGLPQMTSARQAEPNARLSCGTPGATYFTDPAQRRYEALRAYVLEGAPAEAVGRRFGYSVATVYQMAAELRAGRASSSCPRGPGQRAPQKRGRCVTVSWHFAPRTAR
jgi:hypothetical protein